MPKIEIDVDAVLTAAVPLEIEVGDKVFVMNGLIVGLVEKPRRRDEPNLFAAPSHAAPDPLSKKLGRPAGSPNAPRPPGARMVDDLAITTLLRDGPVKARELAKRLNLKTPVERTRLKTRLDSLKSRKVIIPADDARFPTYKLNPAAGQFQPTFNGAAH